MERDFDGYFSELAIREPQRLSASAREIEVLRYHSHGLTQEQCADALGIGAESVKTHMAEARRKLAAKNTAHAVAIALRLGLID